MRNPFSIGMRASHALQEALKLGFKIGLDFTDNKNREIELRLEKPFERVTLVFGFNGDVKNYCWKDIAGIKFQGGEN